MFHDPIKSTIKINHHRVKQQKKSGKRIKGGKKSLKLLIRGEKEKRMMTSEQSLRDFRGHCLMGQYTPSSSQKEKGEKRAEIP
jgi:hypothetical protein